MFWQWCKMLKDVVCPWWGGDCLESQLEGLWRAVHKQQPWAVLYNLTAETLIIPWSLFKHSIVQGEKVMVSITWFHARTDIYTFLSFCTVQIYLIILCFYICKCWHGKERVFMSAVKRKDTCKVIEKLTLHNSRWLKFWDFQQMIDEK